MPFSDFAADVFPPEIHSTPILNILQAIHCNISTSDVAKCYSIHFNCKHANDNQHVTNVLPKKRWRGCRGGRKRMKFFSGQKSMPISNGPLITSNQGVCAKVSGMVI